MRIIFLIPDLRRDVGAELIQRLSHTRVGALVKQPPMSTTKVYGGTLNLMRHAQVARRLGTDVVLATASGEDHYGDTWGITRLPFVAWRDRRRDDLCIVPDVYTRQIDAHAGPAVAYLQNPLHVHADFDFQRPNVELWTDSPMMLEVCEAHYPGKTIPIVPNIIDNRAFEYRPQSARNPGELIAFPRKGPQFITDTMRAYRELGGTYWRLELIDGLPFRDLAARFRTPQAFLASGEIEGCALPPQESMAAGLLVVGRNAGGANFSMRDGETALVANTPDEAARALLAAEDDNLRSRVACGGYEFIQRFFPENEPARFWRERLGFTK